MKYELQFVIPFDTIHNVRDVRMMGMRQMICFGTGKFDDFCAYAVRLGADGRLYAAMPLDKYYFEIIDLLCKVHGKTFVYDDVKHLFEQTGKTIEQRVIDEIYRMASAYGLNFEWALNAFYHLYYGMVAEENKANTRLGKSIKMHGIDSMVRESRSVEDAADECRSMKWTEIHRECLDRHIYRMS